MGIKWWFHWPRLEPQWRMRTEKTALSLLPPVHTQGHPWAQERWMIQQDRSPGSFCSSASPRGTCAIIAADLRGSCFRLCSPESLTSASVPGLDLGYRKLPLQCSCKSRERGTQNLPTREQLDKYVLSLAKRELADNIITVIPRDSFCWITPLGGSPPISLVPVWFKKKNKNSLVNFKMLQVKANCFP